MSQNEAIRDNLRVYSEDPRTSVACLKPRVELIKAIKDSV